MPVIVICKTCKKHLLVPPKEALTKRFCSRSCYTIEKRKKVYNQHLKRRIKKTCKYCKKQFEVHLYRKDSALYCSYSCRAKDAVEEKGANWKGDAVGYHGVHVWIAKHLGKAKRCVDCNDMNAPKYEWANVSGEYKRDMTDWKELCKKCHVKFDEVHKKMWETRRRQAKTPYHG